MPNRHFSLHRLFLLCLALAVFFACHLTKNEDVEDSFSFPALKDSIAGADQALIVLKAESGQVIDTLFNGPVMASTTFKGLKAPHFTGGKVTIEIQATQGGKVIYQITRSYDGDTDETLGTVVLVSPSSSVKIQWPSPKLREGDSVPLPATIILPATLSNPSLVWASRPGTVLLAGETYLKALLPGSATLVVWLKADPTKRDSVVVEVYSKHDPIKALDSLKLTPDPLTLALRGPAGRFTVNPSPASASKEVTWTALDVDIVTVSADGLLHPVALGTGRILAVSKLEPTALDTAKVEVIAAVKVDSVRFEKDSVEVFVQGSPDSLRVLTYPALANPSVTFSVQDASVAQIEGGKVKGLKEGETWVLARSVEDPTQVDSLRLIVFPLEKVDSVRLAQDSLKVYVKGESQSLTASIFPSTLQKRFLWRSADPALATVDAAGRVTPVSEGKVYVSATARADGQRRDSALVIVKKDTPQLTVGRDTVVAVGTSLTHTPVVTQEYGLVVMFKWDLNGDGTYEDSSTTVRPNLAYLYNEAKDYGVRFYVRDTEGHDTVVIRKVKAVNGRVVQILSPKDGSFTNQSPITVTWMVDGVQEANSQALNLGANTLVRSARDSAQNTYSASITVTLDQTAPNRPTVKGSLVPVNTLTPAWSWTSGGGGGNGAYRYRLDNPDMTAATVMADTFYTASTNQSAGTHTLYVQERDEAGNWSPSGSFAVRIDTTAPPAPTLTVTPASPTNNPKPTWSWTGGVGDAYRYYRYKIGDEDFRSGGKDTTGTSFTPATGFADGTYTLFVQERDSAGNWSASSFKLVTIDRIAPASPVLIASSLSPLNTLRPTWKWTAGGGGIGTYRIKLDDTNMVEGSILSTTTYTPNSDLSQAEHILYVQERDSAGNWSMIGSSARQLSLREIVGNRGFSKYGATYFWQAINSNEIPYVLYKDAANHAQVMSLFGNTWGLVGNADIGNLNMNFSGIAINEQGVPHLGYTESDPDSTWIRTSAGIIGFRNGLWIKEGPSMGKDIEIKTISRDHLGRPVVVARNIGTESGSSLFVMRLNVNAWEPIGNAQIVSANVSAQYVDLAFNRAGDAFLSFYNAVNDAVSVMKCANGSSSWGYVGEENPLGLKAYRLTMVLDNQGDPSLAIDYSEGLTLARFKGGAWSTFPGPSNSCAGGFSYTIGKLNNPILAFNACNPVGFKVMSLIGSSWTEMGTPNPLPNQIVDVGNSSITVSPLGVPFFGFIDKAVESKLTVTKLSFDPN